MSRGLALRQGSAHKRKPEGTVRKTTVGRAPVLGQGSACAKRGGGWQKGGRGVDILITTNILIINYNNILCECQRKGCGKKSNLTAIAASPPLRGLDPPHPPELGVFWS